LSSQLHTIAGLYAIADRGFNPFGSTAELARKYLEGGARIVQLRMKSASNASDVEGEARQIMKLKGEFDFTFIVNDRVDVALEVGADGVHVGKNDESIDSIKARSGGKLIVGYSSHSKDEAVEAERRGADYVAFGAIFPTRTKGAGHPVQGLEALEGVAKSVRIPLVAIGGIGRHNVQDVIGAGADAIAMITSLSMADDVVAEVRWFVNVFKDGVTRGGVD